MENEKIIEQLTLEEKAFLLTGKDFWSTLNIDRLGIPSIGLSDGPHGLRKQAAASDHLGLNKSLPATCFPTAAGMANTWNPELCEKVGVMLGEEAASMNVGMLLGPGMNIKRNPLCGRNFEYFSEDPYLAGKIAAGYVRGIQSNGVTSCIKHFACNNQEYRRMSSNSEVDERALREIYLTGFEIAVKEGKTNAIMSSYNKINGTYADENSHLLKEILRDTWGFNGVVVSDWAGDNDKVAATKAGSDIEMPSCKYGAEDIIKAVNDGTLDIKDVDNCVDKVISFALREKEVLEKANKTFDIEAHHEFAYKAAIESAVLLKNENQALPLNNKEKVCLIGDFANDPRYQGAGSSVVNPTKIDSYVNMIKEYDLNYIGYEQGYKRYGGKSNGLAKKAIALANQADSVICFIGLDEVSEAEGLDRKTIKIPSNQLELLSKLYETHKKIVVVITAGSSLELEVVEKADAILNAYLAGQAGAKAVLDILSGKVSPSGKLAETYPFKYEDIPSSDNFGRPITTQYRESIFVGYRYFDTADVKVRYPFGYGLSYSSFEYGNLEVNDNGVSFTIKNTGNYDAYETAQLYIGKKDSAIFRAAKELKGFKKVFLKKGEETTVEIPFDDKSFRVFNVKHNQFETEDGMYQIYVGTNVEDIKLQGELKVNGVELDLAYNKELIECYYKADVRKVSNEAYKELLQKEPHDTEYAFYKKKRMVIHENCSVEDLRYSKRWVGRVFSGAIRFAIWFLWRIKAKTTSNTLVMGVLHQPVRGLAKFGGMNRRQMEALLLMFNGHLFKGIGQFLSKGK